MKIGGLGCYLCSRGLLVLAVGLEELEGLRSLAKEFEGHLLLVTPTLLPLGSYDQWSVVYIYTQESRLLEPNTMVEFVAYKPEEVDEGVLGEAESVQKRSWSFYTPPPRGDTVFIARLHGEPMGVAYNTSSSNIDYGIHVA